MSANAINAFMAGRQLRNDREDREAQNALLQEERGQRNTAGKVENALMSGNREQAQRLAQASGSPDIMAQTRQTLEGMGERQREAAQDRLRASAGIAGQLLQMPQGERQGFVAGNAGLFQALGVDPREIMGMNLTDDVLQSYIGSVMNMDDDLFAARNAPTTLGRDDLRLDPVTGARDVNPLGAEYAQTQRITANARKTQAETGAAREERERAAPPGPEWITLPPGDPRRAGFDEGEVVQYNTRTGQVARRSVDRVFNATESQAAGFAGRMNDASGILASIEQSEEFRGVPELMWSRSPRTLPEQWQRYRQAGENWIRANLRRESGAVIGEDEMAAEFRVYMPQPGDSSEVIAQKANSRARAEQAMRAQSRGAYAEYGLDRPPALGSNQGRTRADFASDAEYDAYLDSQYQ